MNFECGMDPDDHGHGQRGWTTLFEWECGGVFVVQNHMDSVDSLSLDLILSLSFYRYRMWLHCLNCFESVL